MRLSPFLIAAMWFLTTTQTEACHRFSIWHYPTAQRCAVRVAQIEAPVPPSKPMDYYEPKAPDIPLPSLKDMEFPPDCDADWCQRMKGIGLLRAKLGTN